MKVVELTLNLSRDQRMRRIALLGLIVALAACNNDSTSPNGSAVGSYSLHTYNGATLPVQIGNDVLVSDQLVLNANGTYTDQASFQSGFNQTEQGNWSISNNLITFQDFTDQLQYPGSLSGSVLTETFTDNFGNSITEVYQRQ
jgi:hypothetical protein